MMTLQHISVVLQHKVLCEQGTRAETERRDRGGWDSGRIKWGQLLLKDEPCSQSCLCHMILIWVQPTRRHLDFWEGEIFRERKSGKHRSICIKIKENRWRSEKDTWREMKNKKTFPPLISSYILFYTCQDSTCFSLLTTRHNLCLSPTCTNCSCLLPITLSLASSLLLSPPLVSFNLFVSHSLSPLPSSWCSYQYKGQLRSYIDDVLVSRWCGVIRSVQHLLFAAAVSAL